jgi:hypothetical protein
VASCVFDNNLYLTIEKKRFGNAQLKAYQRHGVGFRSHEEKKSQEHFTLKELKSIGLMSRIRAIPAANGENITIIICNTGEEIGFVSGRLTKTS